MKYLIFIPFFLFYNITTSQDDQVIYDIISEVSSERIKKDIKKLASFGTRHTLSDTLSEKRGIGASLSGFLICP